MSSSQPATSPPTRSFHICIPTPGMSPTRAKSSFVTSDGDMAHTSTQRHLLHQRPFTIVHRCALPCSNVQLLRLPGAGRSPCPFWQGTAALQEGMRAEYKGRLLERGAGRSFHSLRHSAGELNYIKDLVDWVNRDGEINGAPSLAGHTEEWIAGYWAMRERLKGFFEKENKSDAAN